jgi:hypothetical protein
MGSGGQPSLTQRLAGVGMLLLGALVLFVAFEAIAGRHYYVDWVEVFYPVALVWRSPYSIGGFYNPPWLSWLLRPFAAFGPHFSYTAWIIVTVSLALWAMRRLGAPLPAALLCLLSPYYYGVLINGNVDVVILAGFALLDDLAGLGALLLLVKPQELGLALLGARYRRRDIAIIVAVVGASFAIDASWPIAFVNAILERGPQAGSWNFSIFPYGLPVAALLVAGAIASQDRALLGAACPFLSPYVTGLGFFPLLSILLPRVRRSEQIVLVATAWVVIQALHRFILLERLLVWCGYASTLYVAGAILIRQYRNAWRCAARRQLADSQ